MIKNEKQYKISKKFLNSLNEDIRKIEGNNNRDPLLKEVILTPLYGNKQSVEKELATYEDLKKNKKYVLKERIIDNLPTLLIEYKIMMGYTQKEFSEKLGLKEQQLQRYEAEDYKSVSFKNLVKYIKILELDVRIKETRFEPDVRTDTD